MIGVALAASGAAIGVLYNTAFEGKRASLIHSAQSQTRLIEAIYRHQKVESTTQEIEHTLDQITDAHQNHQGIGHSGEFTLARQVGDQIIYLLRHRHSKLKSPNSVPITSKLSEPMRRALEGESGSIVGLDYRGVEVLAAHEPISVLKLGLVAKIDMTEVRAPFYRAGIYVFFVSIALIALGAGLFIRVSNPLIKNIEESELHRRNLFEFAKDSIFITDPTTRQIIDSNSYAAKQLGYSREELKNLTIYDIDGSDGQSVIEAITEKGEHVFETIHVCKDGSRKPVEISSRLIRYGDGQVIQSFVRDIAERKQIESMRIQLSNSVENSPVGMAIWDSDDRLVMSNKFHRELFAHLKGYLEPGTKFSDLIRGQAESGRIKDAEGRVDAYVEDSINSFRKGNSKYDETLEDGRTIRLQRYLLADNSRITYFTDISEEKAREKALRESEERFRSIAQSASIAMIVAIDHNGIVINWNRAAELAFGYSEKEILGTSITKLIPERYRHAHAKGLAKATKHGIEKLKMGAVELTGLRKDGTEFPLELSVGEWQSGEERYFSAVIHDITERKSAELALQKAHDELELAVHERTTQLRQEIEERKQIEMHLIEANQKADSANRAKSEFLTNMSHELRTPLNAIIGFSETLNHEIFGKLANDQQKEYTGYIHESGEHLLQLINNILDLSTIEAGELILHESAVSLDALIETVLIIVEKQALEKHITLLNRITDSILTLNIDEIRTKQIFVNLLSNAIKFTQEEGVVSVDWTRSDEGGVRITVTDNGIGMDEEGIHTALTKFGQVRKEILDEVEGTGLGIPLSRKLVEAQNGTMTITSELGEGTTVEVEFPKERLI